MGIEIERKFLVVNNDWRLISTGVLYRQGYLSTDKERTVRVRIAGDTGFLTIKGLTENSQRAEFEYAIPFDDAKWMLDRLCKQPLIEKMRFKIEYKGLIWEVDEFLGENQGLVLAEVELPTPDQEIALPDWIGEDVTEIEAYYNANLVINPFRNWSYSAKNK